MELQRLSASSRPRDIRLDIFRGCVMIFIVCYVHAIAWGREGGERSLRFLLIEMPLIFYLLGWAYSLSGGKSFSAYVIGRFRRILPPYFLFVGVAALAFFLFQAAFELPYLRAWRTLVYDGKNVDILANVVKSLSLFSPFSSATWFVRPFLLISCCAPLFAKLFSNRKLPSAFIFIGCVAIVYAIEHLAAYYAFHEAVVFEILCFFVYGFFFVMGMRRSQTDAEPSFNTYYTHNALPILGTAGLAIALWKIFGYPLALPINKEPPNVMFLALSSCIILLTGWWLNRMCVLVYKVAHFKAIIDIYNRRSYEIFLIHVLSFLPVVFLLKVYPILKTNCLFLIFLTVYLLYVNALFGLLFGKFCDTLTKRRVHDASALQAP